MELRERDGDGAFHPSIEYFLGKHTFYCCVLKKAFFCFLFRLILYIMFSLSAKKLAIIQVEKLHKAER